jgi:FkbM family methyltransferase
MMTNRILRLPRSLLRRCGLDLVRYTGPSSRADERRLTAIRRHQVATVLDIGAADGAFGKRLRQSGYQGRIVSFEPLTASFEALHRAAGADPLWETVHAAIGEDDGEAVINVSGRSTSSSLLPMAASHLAAAPDSEYISTERVRVWRLDSILRDLPVAAAGACCMKIDVQGYEGSVLEGAPETLKAAKVVELEMSMVGLYEGSALHAEMISRLDDLGFSLISWEDVLTDPETGYVLQADGIFVRE